MSNTINATRPVIPLGIGGSNTMNTAYVQKLQQARSWLAQGKLDTARTLLSEAKEVAVLNHLDKALLTDIEAKIALREIEDGVKVLVDNGEWPEARELVRDLGDKHPCINQGVITRRIACWFEIIGAAEDEKRRKTDLAAGEALLQDRV